MDAKITVSVIKADIGGFVGHSSVHPCLMERANECMQKAAGDLLVDYHVASVGDDINLILTHRLGVDNEQIHSLAWNTFKSP